MRPGVVSLGDSLSCGVGVGVRVPQPRTWVCLAASALGLPATILASPGARARDVRHHQLPRLPQERASVVTLLVGYNDVAGPGFDPASLADDLKHVVRAARAGGELLVLWRLADPSYRLPVPKRAAAGIRDRVMRANEAIDESAVVGEPTLVLDLAEVGGIRRRDAWAVDRLHTSAFGHYLMAHHLITALRTAGMEIAGSVRAPDPRRVPTRVDELYWLARHGTPWAVGNLGRIGPPALDVLRGSRQRPALRTVGRAQRPGHGPAGRVRGDRIRRGRIPDRHSSP